MEATKIPKVSITRTSTDSAAQSAYTSGAIGPSLRGTSTFDSTIPSLQRPPTTPLEFREGSGYPFPYATRTETNDVSLYRTTTSYSQWEDRGHDKDDITPMVPNRLNDQVDQARPAVDYQDMLWTQIDILDDVRRMAEQSTEDGSFFSNEHTRALEELKRTQYELLKDLKNVEKVLDSSDDHKVIWDSTDIESVRERLYNREYFDGVRSGFENVKQRLDRVGESMKKIDQEE